MVDWPATCSSWLSEMSDMRARAGFWIVLMLRSMSQKPNTARTQVALGEHAWATDCADAKRTAATTVAITPPAMKAPAPTDDRHRSDKRPLPVPRQDDSPALRTTASS